jgi:hypothetical protein
MVLTVDSVIPPGTLEEIGTAVGATSIRAAYLPQD